MNRNIKTITDIVLIIFTGVYILFYSQILPLFFYYPLRREFSWIKIPGETAMVWYAVFLNSTFIAIIASLIFYYLWPADKTRITVKIEKMISITSIIIFGSAIIFIIFSEYYKWMV